jgi:uncharacterized protein YkwD
MNAAARFRYALVAGATTVVIGVGFTVAGFHQRAAAGASHVPPVAAAAPDAGAGAGTGGLLDEAASATTGTDATPSTPPASPSASATPAARRTTSAKPKPRRTTPSPTKKPAASTPPPVTSSAVLNAVLADINQARDAAGLPALTIDAQLSKASALHNQLMIDGCGLAHECPGEQGIGPRFSAQGVQWTRAGENIGFGSSGSSESAIIAAANGLTASMLAEKPPNDGHRQNLLSSSFKRIGLSVLRDGTGKTWMVQDFVN